MLTNILLLPLCFRQKTGHSERSFFPGVRAGKVSVLSEYCYYVSQAPFPPLFISLSFKKKKAQHQHWGESPGKSPNNVATSLVTCSSAQTGQPPENDWYPWILMNAFFFFFQFFPSPPLSAHLDEISFSAHSNRAGHYRRIVIIFFSLCLLCGKHSWFCCCNTDPKRKNKKIKNTRK